MTRKLSSCSKSLTHSLYVLFEALTRDTKIIVGTVKLRYNRDRYNRDRYNRDRYNHV